MYKDSASVWETLQEQRTAGDVEMIYKNLIFGVEMKKTLLAMVMAGTALVGMNNMAQAADGTVHFTGTITADACTINGGTPDQTVDLGTVSSSAMAGVATKSTPTKFALKLTACPAALTSAAVKFDGTSDAVDSTLLKLDTGSTATGVGIEIGEADGTPLGLFTASKSVAITGGAAELDFIGRYKSTIAAPTAGTANGTSQFTLNYN